MIQRIQSVWLLLAGVCSFLTFFFPSYIGTNKAGLGSYELNGKENTGIMLLTAFVTVACLVAIFLYKNRPLQLKICFAAIVLQILLALLYYLQLKDFSTGTYALWCLLHAGVFVLLVLGIKGIYADEKIIKDSDRLR